jgi:hypothetical protein
MGILIYLLKISTEDERLGDGVIFFLGAGSPVHVGLKTSYGMTDGFGMSPIIYPMLSTVYAS